MGLVDFHYGGCDNKAAQRVAARLEAALRTAAADPAGRLSWATMKNRPLHAPESLALSALSDLQDYGNAAGWRIQRATFDASFGSAPTAWLVYECDELELVFLPSSRYEAPDFFVYDRVAWLSHSAILGVERR